MPTVPELLVDLAAEQQVVDRIAADLDDAAWDRPTPAEGWDVRDQIGHLAFFDGAAVRAATDPVAFEADDLAGAMEDNAEYMGRASVRAHELAPAELLAWWRAERDAFAETYAGIDPSTRVPWFGPPMSVPSKITARLMETWAHGQDVVDALGIERKATDRLRHVAHLAVRARPFSYAVRGRDAPAGEVRVELVAPSGERWTWGPGDARDRVSGSALDFCLVLTRRRHRADTELRAEGPLADEWLDLGQAFAGPPGSGRRPGQFAK